MRVAEFIVVLLCAGLVACANPLNLATSNRYTEQCIDADRAGRLDVAEQACYRALVNVDWGNLGPELKSERLYNLGKIKRKLRKYDEAVDLFRQSLVFEQQLSGPHSVKTGRRLAEGSMAYDESDRQSEGVPLVEQLVAIADRYTGSERATVARIFNSYADWSRRNQKPELAKTFADMAIKLGVAPKS